jgi:undecaprenyl-diphosphatase
VFARRQKFFAVAQYTQLQGKTKSMEFFGLSPVGLNLDRLVLGETHLLHSGWVLLQTAEAPKNGLWVSLFQAIVLGVVQGITEFLPISSTAHLLIFRDVFGWSQQKYFIDAIQFGSVIAVVMYFWSDIKQIGLGGWEALCKKDWQREEWKLLVGIAVGTVPALVGGLLLRDRIPETPFVIAVMSIVMALLLGLSEQVGKRKRGFESLEIKDGILVGLGQMIALVPGASRSGSTLTTALFLGLKRDTAARFSFLLGIPTLTIAALYQARKAFGNVDELAPLLVGVVSTFVFSYLSIAWLLKYLQTKNTLVFIWYRLTFGVVLLLAITNNMLRNG